MAVEHGLAAPTSWACRESQASPSDQDYRRLGPLPLARQEPVGRHLLVPEPGKLMR